MHCCGVPVAFRHATWSAKSMCCCHGAGDWNDSNEVCRKRKNTEKGLRNLICITSFYHIGSSLQGVSLSPWPWEQIYGNFRPISTPPSTASIGPLVQTWTVLKMDGWNGLKQWLHTKKKVSCASLLFLFLMSWSWIGTIDMTAFILTEQNHHPLLFSEVHPMISFWMWWDLFLSHLFWTAKLTSIRIL